MNEALRQPPKPGTGLAGALDRFIGPGATPGEIALQCAAGAGAAVITLAYGLLADTGWQAGQLLVATVLALDIFGGIVTNATVAAKRWYHRPGHTDVDHLGFVAVHVAHLLLVAWLLRGGDWVWAAVVYFALMASSVIVLRAPRLLRCPTAMLLVVGALLLDSYALGPTSHLAWFVPAFFLKLLVEHLLGE